MDLLNDISTSGLNFFLAAVEMKFTETLNALLISPVPRIFTDFEFGLIKPAFLKILNLLCLNLIFSDH